MAKKSTKARSIAKRKADDIFSQIVRSHGYCEKCGKGSDVAQMQCAHIVSRRFSNTRTDFRNAFCLCAGCHRYFHDYPKEFSGFVENNWAAKGYGKMFKLSRIATKMDWFARLAELRDIKQATDDGLITLAELRD